jgi:hypothetical protein
MALPCFKVHAHDGGTPNKQPLKNKEELRALPFSIIKTCHDLQGM